MPFQPPPTKYTCPKCGWKKTTAPKTDALMPGDYYTACPSCGHTDLKVKVVSSIQGQLARAINMLKKK